MAPKDKAAACAAAGVGVAAGVRAKPVDEVVVVMVFEETPKLKVSALAAGCWLLVLLTALVPEKLNMGLAAGSPASTELAVELDTVEEEDGAPKLKPARAGVLVVVVVVAVLELAVLEVVGALNTKGWVKAGAGAETGTGAATSELEVAVVAFVASFVCSVAGSPLLAPNVKPPFVGCCSVVAF